MQRLMLFLVLFMSVGATRVCKTFPDYYINENCYDDPDGEREVPDIIRSRGYPVERYEVVTKDGYILTLFRIPSRRKGIPVFLQHGINISSLGWFAAGNDSLAFLLSNAGYDVWLGNFRGTRYSQMHETLSINDPRFWNFGFQELGIYDTYSQLSFVAEKTGSKIRYIGESLGTSTAFVFSTLLVEESVELVEIMLQVTPVVYTTNIKSSIVLAARLSPILTPLLNATLKGVLFKQTPLYRWLYRHALTIFPFQMKLYFFVAMTIVGFDWEQINQELAPVQILQSNDAISIKLLNHFFVNHIKYDGQFLQYDYGPTENYRLYGSTVPPSYNLSKVQVPNYLIYGDNDQLGSKENVMRLYHDLPDSVKKYGYWAPDYKKFEHTDFLIAKDVKSLAYNHIVEFLNSL